MPALLAIAPNAAWAAIYLVTWIAPGAFGPFMVRHLMLVMLIEFLVVHSGPFLGTLAMDPGKDRRKRIGGLLGVGGMYAVMALGFALGFKTWWPVGAMVALALTKVLHVWLGHVPSERQKQVMMAGWAAGVFWYLVAVFVTTFLAVPRFGITPAVVRAQDLPGTGEWIDHPEKVIAAGFLYFAALAVSQAFIVRASRRPLRATLEPEPVSGDTARHECRP